MAATSIKLLMKGRNTLYPSDRNLSQMIPSKLVELIKQMGEYEYIHTSRKFTKTVEETELII